jgi:protein required for attachment to host cells
MKRKIREAPPIPRHQPIVWVLVADKSVAKIFFKTKQKLRILTEILPQPTLTEGMDNRNLGRNRSPSGRHMKYDPAMTESRQDEITFVGEICSRLDRAAQNGEFEMLAVIAPPVILGLLRAGFSPAVQERIFSTINKELAHHDTEDITKALSIVFPDSNETSDVSRGL